MDTIFALSSGPPPAAISIVRVSGPAATRVSQSLLVGNLPKPRVAELRTMRDPADCSVLDRALVLVFPAPNTATGEDIVEFHLHGSIAVVRAVERVLGLCDTVRRAEPGEFTRRALINGRLTLAEAEALGDLLTAETEQQRRVAVEQGPRLSKIFERWTDELLRLSAIVEVGIDYDEEDDPTEAAHALQIAKVGSAALAGEIDTMLQQPTTSRLYGGITVAIAGPPNSGKSSLMNALAQDDVAIVSPTAGTTRDRIEARVVRNGLIWRLIDTAGLRDETSDAIERIGIELATNVVNNADLVIWMGDEEGPSREGIIEVHARADDPSRAKTPAHRLALSSHSGIGIEQLWTVLETSSQRLLPQADSVAANERQRGHVSDLATALRLVEETDDLILAGEGLRRGRIAADRLTGRGGTEQMLDALFSNFCVGK